MPWVRIGHFALRIDALVSQPRGLVERDTNHIAAPTDNRAKGLITILISPGVVWTPSLRRYKLQPAQVHATQLYRLALCIDEILAAHGNAQRVIGGRGREWSCQYSGESK